MTEQDRLLALVELDLLDTPPEKEFNDIVLLASASCASPISSISLVDAERQWFKASVGLPVKETHRDLSFCTHAIERDGIFVVEDATTDERFQQNELVTKLPGIRFYAGAPLHAPNGAAVGTLCVIDMVPRKLSEIQLQALTVLAAQVEACFELRLKHKEIENFLKENQRLHTVLKDSNDIFHAFMKNAPFACYIKEANGAMVFYNKFLADHGGVDEKQWIGLKDDEIWPPDLAAEYRRSDLVVLQSHMPFENQDLSLALDGETVFWRSIKFPYQHPKTGQDMLAGISLDVTRQVTQEAELEDAHRGSTLLSKQLTSSQHLLRNFMEYSPSLMYVKKSDGRFCYYNCEVQTFFGIDETSWIGKTIDEVVGKEEADAYNAQDQLVLTSGQNAESVEDAIDKHGVVHKLRSVRFTYKDLDGDLLLATISQDITEQTHHEEELAAANQQLKLLATTDSLTDLSTRRVFESRAEIEFSIARRKQRDLSMLVMDVDDFKIRNDKFGHAKGDDALRIVGKALRGSIRLGDTAARIGGEEFALLLPEINSAVAIDLAKRIQNALRRENAGDLALTLSIGVSSMDDRTGDWNDLLSQADDAMYEAKRSGKNRVVEHREPVPERKIHFEDDQQAEA